MRVMITGGSGFVGLNVAEALLARGDAVVLFGPDRAPDAAIRHFGGLPGTLNQVSGDVRDRDAVVSALTEGGATHLVHGAAVTAGLDREASEARRIVEVNLGGTIEVLEAALACGIKRVVQFGTGAIYANVAAGIESLDEVRDLPTPESLYAITKYAAERTALRYRATRGLDVVVPRLGVVFGRWEYDTGVRDTLSLPFQLAATADVGGEARFQPSLSTDWVYAPDVAAAVLRLLDAPAPLPSPVYHVSSGRRWSIERWCERLRAAFPAFRYEIAGVPSPPTPGVPRPRPPFSVQRMERELGFVAKFGEEEAFADYLAWRATIGADLVRAR